jgi:type III secretion protein U
VAKKDDAEEATFDPSAKRLRRLREDGQVPRSQDFTGAVSLIAVLIYLFLARDTILEQFRVAFRDAPTFAPISFWDRVVQSGALLSQLTLMLSLPFIAITIFSALLATILDVKGFLFSLKPMTPNIGKLNPFEGIKNLFTMRSLIDLIKSLIKIGILFTAVGVVVKMHLNDAFWAPTCGVSCVMYVGLVLVAWIMAIGALLLLVAAAIDLLISRWLFTRDNKMTLTEMKREQKEDYGSPEVRSARRAERNRMSQGAGLTGLNAANMFVQGRDGIVGIAYKPQLSGVPIVAAKAMRINMDEFINNANERGIRIIQDPALAASLMKTGRVGEPIPRDTFTPVARALIQAGFTG